MTRFLSAAELSALEAAVALAESEWESSGKSARVDTLTSALAKVQDANRPAVALAARAPAVKRAGDKRAAWIAAAKGEKGPEV